MNWLLWKDYRQNRLVVLAALAILLGPYLIGFGIIIVGCWVKAGIPDGQGFHWTPWWREIVMGASVYSLVISQLSIALIGGNAISGERVDNSSAFLYSLPIRRKKLLASKLLLSLAIAAIPWLLNVLVLWCLCGMGPIPPHKYQDVFVLAVNIAITGLIFFCVAWFLSSFVCSPIFDVCGGVITPFFVVSGISLVYWMLEATGSPQLAVDGWTFTIWYWGICLTLAPICFGVGTWHYLRRVEP